MRQLQILLDQGRILARVRSPVKHDARDPSRNEMVQPFISRLKISVDQQNCHFAAQILQRLLDALGDNRASPSVRLIDQHEPRTRHERARNGRICRSTAGS